MTTLSTVLQGVFRSLGQLTVVPATDGDTTWFSVSSLAGTNEDDAWKGGAFFIVQTTDGEAPQGEFGLITGYEDAEGKFLFDALTSSVDPGDLVAYASSLYPLHVVIECVNDGLRGLGDIVLCDTSLLVVSGQSEYTLPAGLAGRPPYRVDVQGQNVSGDNRWQQIYGWEFVHAFGGDSHIIIPSTVPTGYYLRLWYAGTHPVVRAHDDEISDSVPERLAIMAGVAEALRWQNRRMGGHDDFMAQEAARAQIDLQNEIMRNSVVRPPAFPKVFPIGSRVKSEGLLD